MEERKKKCCAKHSLNLCICILLPSTHQKVSDDNKRKAKKNSTEKSERTECNVYKIKIIYRRSHSTQLNSILFAELQPQSNIFGNMMKNYTTNKYRISSSFISKMKSLIDR